MRVTDSTDRDERLVQRFKPPASPDYDVVIIGAGPYGLAAAAHLKAKGVGVQVFGEPMEFWAKTMPEGMLLRSPRAASNISDPRSAAPLEAYEAAAGLKAVAPLPLATFVEYGRWFQRELAISVNRSRIARVTLEGRVFHLKTVDGESIRSRRVVIAAGIGPFKRKPAIFASLPPQQVSHCYEGLHVHEWAGKRVAVIGAGQSALESAALLSEATADVEVIAAIPKLRWIGQHGWLHHLGPISKLLYSKYDVGPVGISRLVASPGLVAHVPAKTRDQIRVRAVRPAGAPWLIPRIQSVRISPGQTVRSARTVIDEVELKLDDGTERRVDHVLLGTGYEVDIKRYEFLAPELVSQVRVKDGYPTLGADFCSSVPGLHFIGGTAAHHFGPLLYFVAGTKFASAQLATYIHRYSRQPL
jgi:hypothetical protein